MLDRLTSWTVPDLIAPTFEDRMRVLNEHIAAIRWMNEAVRVFMLDVIEWWTERLRTR